MNSTPKTLGERLFEAAEKFADRPFLIAADRPIEYKTAWAKILNLAGGIAESDENTEFVGIFAERQHFAYSAILATLAAGKSYVPLNPRLPNAKLASIIVLSGMKMICVGKGLNKRLSDILQCVTEVERVLCETPPEEDTPRGSADWVNSDDYDAGLNSPIRPRENDPNAYLFFTSGSTGKPKGVLVSNQNVVSYLDNVCNMYGYGPDDVHSQTFELSFDLSVHDMACAWTTGGALVPLQGGALLAPQQAILDNNITCWFSVPSIAALMVKQSMLKENSFQNLRISLFCGEAMPVSIARKWKEAAPNSIIENLYGPTEATIAITNYRWNDEADNSDRVRHGVVPIGNVFSGQRTGLLDSKTCQLIPEHNAGQGELVLSGNQVTTGYFKAPAITASSYLSNLEGEGKIWYRTGDLVERDNSGCLHFIGRIDFQVKMNGYRIEISEIEHALRHVAKTDHVTVVPWPSDGQPVQQLVAVISGTTKSEGEIRKDLSEHIPGYMMPRRIELWDELPLNINHKVDRKRILELLEAQ